MLRVTFAMVTKTKNRRMKNFSKNCSHFNLWYIKYWNNYTVNFQINVKKHWWANKKLKNVTMEAENYFKKKHKNKNETPARIHENVSLQTKDNPRPVCTCCSAVKMMLCRVPRGKLRKSDSIRNEFLIHVNISKISSWILYAWRTRIRIKIE